MAKTLSDYQFEVNRACKGEVSRHGIGFKVTYSPDTIEADMASDIEELHKLDYEPQVSEKKKFLTIPLYLSKYPA